MNEKTTPSFDFSDVSHKDCVLLLGDKTKRQALHQFILKFYETVKEDVVTFIWIGNGTPKQHSTISSELDFQILHPLFKDKIITDLITRQEEDYEKKNGQCLAYHIVFEDVNLDKEMDIGNILLGLRILMTHGHSYNIGCTFIQEDSSPFFDKAMGLNLNHIGYFNSKSRLTQHIVWREWFGSLSPNEFYALNKQQMAHGGGLFKTKEDDTTMTDLTCGISKYIP